MQDNQNVPSQSIGLAEGIFQVKHVHICAMAVHGYPNIFKLSLEQKSPVAFLIASLEAIYMVSLAEIAQPCESRLRHSEELPGAACNSG